LLLLLLGLSSPLLLWPLLLLLLLRLADTVYLVDFCLKRNGEDLRVQGQELLDGKLLNLHGLGQKLVVRVDLLVHREFAELL